MKTSNNNIKAKEKDKLLEDIVDLLKSKVNLHSIYLIGRSETAVSSESIINPIRKEKKLYGQFTVLIVSYNSILSSIASLTYGISNELSCDVCIIDYVYDEVVYKLNRGCRPLERFLTEAMPLYYKDSAFIEMKISQHYFPSDWRKINRIWNARMKRADYLLKILIDPYDEIDEDSSARMGVMHYAMEQICMGLLYVYWEYRPSYYKLPYLLLLCGNFTDLTDKYFSKFTYTNHNMYHLLCFAHDSMRNKAKSTITKRQAEMLFNHCEYFYQSALKVGNAELNRLHPIYYQEEIEH